jgi:hypothetical protein
VKDIEQEQEYPDWQEQDLVWLFSDLTAGIISKKNTTAKKNSENFFIATCFPLNISIGVVSIN